MSSSEISDQYSRVLNDLGETKRIFQNALDETQKSEKRLEALYLESKSMKRMADEYSKNVKKLDDAFSRKKRCLTVACVIAMLITVSLFILSAFGTTGLFAPTHSLPSWLSQAVGTIGHSGLWTFMIGGGILGLLLLGGSIYGFGHRKFKE